MSDDVPRDYDREHTDRLGGGIRVRLGYSHDRGDVTRFVVQLEYPEIGLDRVEDHLSNNLRAFVERFESWHEIESR